MPSTINLKQTLIGGQPTSALISKLITYSNTILINLIITTNHKTQRTPKKHEHKSESDDARIKLKTQPFFLYPGILTIAETILKNSRIPHQHARLERDGRGAPASEKNERRTTEKGCKVLRIAYILTP